MDLESLYRAGTEYPSEVARIWKEFYETHKDTPGYDIQLQFESFLQTIGLFKVDIREKSYPEVRDELSIIMSILLEQ